MIKTAVRNIQSRPRRSLEGRNTSALVTLYTGHVMNPGMYKLVAAAHHRKPVRMIDSLHK